MSQDNTDEFSRRDILYMGAAVTGAGGFFPVAHELQQEGNTGRRLSYEISIMNNRYGNYHFDADTTEQPPRAIGTTAFPDKDMSLQDADRDTVVDAVNGGEYTPLDHVLRRLYEKHLGQYNSALEHPRSPDIDEYEVRFEGDDAYVSWVASGDDLLSWEDDGGFIDGLVEQVWDRGEAWQYRLDSDAYDEHFAEHMDIVPYDE